MTSIIPKYSISCDDKHIYRVDGKLVAGVSEILSGLGMVDFRHIPTHVLEQARNLGTEVHSVCEDFDKGSLKIKTVDPVIAPYFKAYLLFLKENKAEVLEIETAVYSKVWNYCGRLDRIISIDGKIILLDLKTSTMLLPTMETQTMLYKIAWEEMTGKKIKARWVLQLKPDGTYKTTLHKDSSPDSMVALACVSVFNRKLANGLMADADYTREIFGF